MSETQTGYRDDKIRAAQAAKDWTDRQLADFAGVGHRTVWEVTNGKWSGKVSTLEKIADALGLTLQEVFEPREEVA